MGDKTLFAIEDHLTLNALLNMLEEAMMEMVPQHKFSQESLNEERHS